MRGWKAAFQVAATYIGTVVGAGFASGQEIMQFFTVHGLYGAFAIAISTLLFIWLGCKMMSIARGQQCFSFRELNVLLFGPKLAWLVNGMALLILFGTTGVMLSGSGSLFAEQLGFAPQLGILLTMALCLIVMWNGMKGVLWINSLVVPVMLLFTLILAVRLTGEDWGNAPLAAGSHGKWLWSALLYAGFNLAMAQAVLVPVGHESGQESVIRRGGILGGIGLGVMLLTSHFSLWIDWDRVKDLDIPIARLISTYGNWMAILFAIVVYGEIFTTVAGNVFGLARQLQSIWKLAPLAGATLILFGSFLLSQWGFRSLVSSLYPAFGVIGLAFIARIAIFRQPAGKSDP